MIIGGNGMKKFRNWRKNAVIATVMLFICAGIYLNWSYTQNQAVADLTQTLDAEQVLGQSTLVLGSEQIDEAAENTAQTTTDYFAAVRLSRQESRDHAVSTLQETMAYEDLDANKSKCAASLDVIVNTALDEAQIESLVIAKGYSDCVTYITDETVSVAVSAPAEGLSKSDVALISDVVLSNTGYELEDIRIIEVK
jgi:stage III sporulation protein AH